MITALCGGVGGSKLVLGLYRTVFGDELSVVVNTADDLEFCGLHVSPDLDTVVYTLAGISRRDVGWGIDGDTHVALCMLERFGSPTWFQIGDRDLATDLFRTDGLRRGLTLTAITHHIRESLGIQARVLPMTDSRVTTRLRVTGEWVDFQEYFVHRGHRDRVEAVHYDGIAAAVATEDVREAVSGADTIVLVNSNPVLSILPILEVSGINELVAASAAPRVAVSPIVGIDAVSGPAGALMRLVGQPSTAFGVANAYLGLIDGIVIDRHDSDQVADIEALGLSVLCTDTIMRNDADRDRLAADTLSFARELR